MNSDKKDFKVATMFMGALESIRPAAVTFATVGACIDGFLLSGNFSEAAKTFVAVGACTIAGGGVGGAFVSFDKPNDTLHRMAYGAFAGAAIGFAVSNIDNLPSNEAFSATFESKEITLTL